MGKTIIVLYINFREYIRAQRALNNQQWLWERLRASGATSVECL